MKTEKELLKWRGVYLENKRLANQFLNHTFGFTYMHGYKKSDYEEFRKNQKIAKKQIFKILKQMSGENNI